VKRASQDATSPTLAVHVGMTLKEVERLLIAATLKHTGHNVSASAKLLGIDRSTLYSKIKEYDPEH